MRILTQLIRRPAAAQVVEGVVNDVMRGGYTHPYAVRIVTGAVHRAQRRGWGPQFVGRRIAGQTVRLSGGGIGQGASVLFGKTQSYYSLLDSVQNRVIGIQAEMSQIGKDAWDNALWSNLSDVSNAGWEPVENYLFDPMLSWWRDNYKKLVRTPTVEPTEATVNEVNRLAAGTDNLIAFVKKYLPRGDADAATAYRKEAIDKVDNYKLTSPGDTARQIVIDEIQKKIGGGVTQIVIIAAIAAAAAAGAYAFFGRRGR